MHFCMEEVAALAAVIPGFFAVRMWLKRKWGELKVWRARRRLSRKR